MATLTAPLTDPGVRMEAARALPILAPSAEGACPTCAGARFIRTRPLVPGETSRFILGDDAPRPSIVVPNVEPCPDCASSTWTPEQLADHRIPPERLFWTFDAFRPEEGKQSALAETTAWSERVLSEPRRSGSVVLWGPTPGVGKTHLAIASVLHIARRRRAQFWPVQQVMSELQSRFGKDGGQEFEARLHRLEVLVLDDLGAETKSASGWSTGIVLALIEARQAASLPTLITTNLAPAALEAHVEARAASRLQEFQFVRVAGLDMRGRK